MRFSGSKLIFGVLGEDGLYYFTTQDTALTPDQKAKKETGVSAPQLLELLRKVKAQRLLILINACFSGHVGPTLGPAPVPGAPLSATLGLEVLATGEGRVISRWPSAQSCRPSAGAQAFNIQAGGDVSIDQGRRLIDFGSGNQIGNVTMGDLAGRDIVKVTVTTAPAAGVTDDQELLKVIDQLRAEVAKLTDAPEGAPEDAEDELRKAREAGQKGNKSRLLEKLTSAQKVLLSLGGGVAAAVKLADALSALVQRAIAMRGLL